MHIEFVGAAQTVTGSMHLVHTKEATILLDCGLFQGRRAESFERNRRLSVDPRAISAVVLSHAHIDHSGALPTLVKNGYEGPVYATPATRDLCAVMLRDAAAIQAADARFLNRQAEKGDPECYDAETRALLHGRDSPFDFPELVYVDDPEDSKAVDREDGPAIIISASGMCEAGRILHHLKAGIEDPRNTVLIVGFQAQHTLGRRLVEQRARVKIFGVERERRAEVVVLNGFSAHADQKDLVAYAAGVAARGPLRHIALVHGDPGPQRILAGLLAEKGHDRVAIPASGDRLVVD